MTLHSLPQHTAEMQQILQDNYYLWSTVCSPKRPTLTHIAHLEWVQCFEARLVRGLHVRYEERLRQLERRCIRADLVLTFNILKINLRPPDFFRRVPQSGLRGHTYRILQEPIRFDKEVIQVLCVWWNNVTNCRLLVSYNPQYPS